MRKENCSKMSIKILLRGFLFAVIVIQLNNHKDYISEIAARFEQKITQFNCYGCLLTIIFLLVIFALLETLAVLRGVKKIVKDWKKDEEKCLKRKLRTDIGKLKILVKELYNNIYESGSDNENSSGSVDTEDEEQDRIIQGITNAVNNMDRLLDNPASPVVTDKKDYLKMFQQKFNLIAKDLKLFKTGAAGENKEDMGKRRKLVRSMGLAMTHIYSLTKENAGILKDLKPEQLKDMCSRLSEVTKVLQVKIKEAAADKKKRTKNVAEKGRADKENSAENVAEGIEADEEMDQVD